MDIQTIKLKRKKTKIHLEEKIIIWGGGQVEFRSSPSSSNEKKLEKEKLIFKHFERKEENFNFCTIYYDIKENSSIEFSYQSPLSFIAIINQHNNNNNNNNNTLNFDIHLIEIKLR